MAVIRSFNGKTPRIDPTAFIAENAVLVGDVLVGPRASIWYGCVIRADVCRIEIGEATNVQDGTIIHVNHDYTGNGCMPTIIGSNVTIGHRALLHACRLESKCFVGMDAVVMDEAVIESGAMVGAGALVTPRKRVKHRELWTGRPAKKLRELQDEELEYFSYSAEHYTQVAGKYSE